MVVAAFDVGCGGLYIVYMYVTVPVLLLLSVTVLSGDSGAAGMSGSNIAIDFH